MLQISSFKELDEVMSNLHDCPFDLDRANLDYTTGVWQGTFLRPLWEDPRAEHRKLSLLYLRSRLPVVEATLTVSGVRGQAVIDDPGLGRYTFNEVELDANGLQLRFNEALRIHIDIAGSIAATYEEQPLPGFCATYRQVLLVQSGPKIEPLGSAVNDEA